MAPRPPPKRQLRIPPNEYWPAGFETNFVSGFFDAPRLWAPGRWPWQWFRTRHIDLKPASWWHDLRYFLGFFVRSDIAWDKLSELVPLENAKRNDTQRAVIDHEMRKDFIAAGMAPPTASLAQEIVMSLGNSNFYWATPKNWERRARPWER